MSRAAFRLFVSAFALSALAIANPIKLSVSQNAQPAMTFTGIGAVAYGSTGNLKPVSRGKGKAPVFNVAIVGLTQPTLSSPNLLSLATFDYKLFTTCFSNCVLNVDLTATGFNQPFHFFRTDLSGFILNGGPGAHYLLTAWLNPFNGSPILLGSCTGRSNSAASCQNQTAFTYTGTYGLELKLTLDANGGSGTFTDSNISGAVPEPGMLSLFGVGLLSLAVVARTRISA